jgi:hypothetical protein
MNKDKTNLHLKYVRVTGIFRLGFKELLGNPSNGIPEVKSVVVWSDPASPLRQKLCGTPGVNCAP